MSPGLYRFLLTELADDAYVLLEFHSGGRDQRQVDIAVLGPYGVDIVEVKAKTGGAVIASANGAWHIRRDDGKLEALPLNGAARENPYDQADRTATDFKQCLETELRIFTKVFPLVVVPKYRRDHNLRNRGFVWAANGLGSFKRSLRSWRFYKDQPQTLDVQQWERIVKALGLTELHADEMTLTPQKDAVIDSLPQISVGTSRAHAHSDAVPARLPAVLVSQVTPLPLVLDSATSVPRNNLKHRSVQLTAGLALCVATAVLSLVWTTEAAVRATEQTQPTLTAPIEAEVYQVASPKSALPGTSYRPAQEAATTSARSLTPSEGLSCPYSHPVKGNISSEGERIFHVAGQRYYEQTKPERCFSSAEAALAAGFRASLR